MSQKSVIWGLLDAGKNRDEIEAETGYKKVTVGYYERMWKRGLEPETIEAKSDEEAFIAPRKDDFDLEEEAQQTAPPSSNVHRFTSAKRKVEPFFRVKQAS